MGITITTINTAREIVEEMLNRLEVKAEVGLRATEDMIFGNITTDQAGLLIGHNGETLAALQTVVSLMLARRLQERIHLVLDVGGYRERREEALTDMARQTAEEVMLSKKPITLEPMQPFERRVVHLVLQGYPEIATESEGEDPERRVVIKPA